MTLAQKIRNILAASDMSQAELARRCRMSEAAISRLVSRRRTEITVTTARRLARGLGTTVSALLAEEE